MHFAKLALLAASLGVSTIPAAPSPEKTEDDFDEIGSLSTDVQRVIDSMPVRGYDASTVHDLFSATVDLVNGISDINKANADVQVEDFDDQKKEDTCTSVHRTRYTQGSLIKQFLDEVNSRLDDCSDAYKQRLEENIKTAKAQYDAITPKA
ncbi:hypothetical protein CEP51_000532 [Fusarium floridanum]|uniref:Uncharacterized protein n=1 Tax=Fusarium floridanum TaxID=1325733 RepID=A0A428SLX8_9HYPO|nr:hypothetical protein CEP51_000532 [Fusarium floridanum]